MRGVCAALLVAVAAPALAQSPQPTVELDFPVTEAVPGQPLSLRLTVLVPTFMPRPAEFPTLELPNVRVRLPERATGPVTRRVGQDSWSGVSRHYLVTPLIAGDFSVPPQDVTVTWQDGDAPRTAVLKTEAFAFRGVVPPGAGDLDPFIAATDLALAQEISGDPAAMAPGDGVTRTVTATIAGASPMVLPPLLPPTTIAGVAAYPDAPAVAETDARGVLSGTRRERVTLMAESGGAGRAPAVALRWFDLDTGTVATARVDGFEVHVDGPAAPAADVPAPVARFVVALTVLAALILATLALTSRAEHGLRALQRRRQATEAFAFARLQGAVSAHDYRATIAAFDLWTARRGDGASPPIREALARLGAARYGYAADAPAEAWTALAAALAATRRHRGTARRAPLPPLNPPPRPTG